MFANVVIANAEFMASITFDTSDSTSSSLIGRVRRRDAVAWQRFADLYTPLVYGWARRGGLQESDAADIVQEVFRTVATKIDDFGRERDGSSFRAWLWAIARNQVRLHYRKLGTQPDPKGGMDAFRLLEEVADDESQDDSAFRSDRRYLLHRTLNLVRGDFANQTWQAFWRTVVDGESATDVADELGMTPVAVRQAKFRVLCRLREEMDSA